MQMRIVQEVAEVNGHSPYTNSKSPLARAAGPPTAPATTTASAATASAATAFAATAFAAGTARAAAARAAATARAMRMLSPRMAVGSRLLHRCSVAFRRPLARLVRAGVRGAFFGVLLCF